MRLALEEARAAGWRGDVPVGAVVLDPGGGLLAAGGNERELAGDPTAHAEVIAVRRAAARLGQWRLTGCTLVVTLEPCAMCASAMIQARVARVVFAAHEPKTGAAGSVLNLFANKQLNQHTAMLGGLLADEAKQQLQAFFRLRR